ncbi:unnamed protein product, partial [Prunus brigantina]
MVLEDKPEDIDDKQWTRINLHACATIRSFLDKELKYPYMKETSAKKLWRKLEEKYMTKSAENRLFLKKRLFRFQYRSGISMHEHLNDYNKILADLANLDVQIPDEDKALCLLNSLPDDYDHLTTTLLYGKSEGHWKKDCPKLKNKEKEKAGSEANIAKSGGEDFKFALASSSADDHSKEWMLDSGCTYHMCPIREWFSSFEELDGGVVLMGNNNACKTQGIGKICLKMHDGTVRELSDVRYVPDMKKNLISLGALESKGLKITMEGGVLKAVHGALVVMKGTRRNNLYFLQGSTVIGGAAVTEAADADSTDTTRLWHMRLGHAGEKALQGLVKQGLLKGAKACKLEFCEHCVLGKQTRVKFGTAIHHTKGILDYVLTDVWGPSKNASWGGSHYFVSFVDDFSRRIWVYTMKRKDEVLKIFLKWKKMIETQSDPRAKKALFMGFSTGVKGYRLWCPDEKKFVVSRDVTFDEAAMVNQNKHEGEIEATKTMSSSKQVELLKTPVVPVRSDTTDTSPTVDSDEEDEDDEEEAPTQEPP